MWHKIHLFTLFTPPITFFHFMVYKCLWLCFRLITFRYGSTYVFLQITERVSMSFGYRNVWGGNQKCDQCGSKDWSTLSPYTWGALWIQLVCAGRSIGHPAWQVVLFNQTQKWHRKLWLPVGFDFVKTANGVCTSPSPCPFPPHLDKWAHVLLPESLVLGNRLFSLCGISILISPPNDWFRDHRCQGSMPRGWGKTGGWLDTKGIYCFRHVSWLLSSLLWVLDCSHPSWPGTERRTFTGIKRGCRWKEDGAAPGTGSGWRGKAGILAPGEHAVSLV